MLNVSKGELQALRRELTIQKSLYHEAIVKMHTSFEKDGFLYIVLEYIKHGNLFNFLRKNKKLPQDSLLNIFYQILTAIDYLHDKKILHRDIKPENILMESDNKIKLCDFGFCAFFGKNVVRQTMCGTTEYLPPEIINGGDQDDKVDVWCLGILLYEMFHNKTPFDGRNVSMLILQQKTRTVRCKPNLDNQIKAIIQRCLEFNPVNRATTKELLTFSIFNKFNGKAVKEEQNLFGVKNRKDASPQIKFNGQLNLKSMPNFVDPNIKKIKNIKKKRLTSNKNNKAFFDDKKFNFKREIHARSVTPVKKVVKYSVNRVDHKSHVGNKNNKTKYVQPPLKNAVNPFKPQRSERGRMRERQVNIPPKPIQSNQTSRRDNNPLNKEINFQQNQEINFQQNNNRKERKKNIILWESGVTLTDTIQTNRDTGFNVTDTIQTNRDTGFTLTDTIQTNRDTGLTLTETGFASRETGFTQRDTNLTMQNTGYIRDTGLTQRDTNLNLLQEFYQRDTRLHNQMPIHNQSRMTALPLNNGKNPFTKKNNVNTFTSPFQKPKKKQFYSNIRQDLRNERNAPKKVIKYSYTTVRRIDENDSFSKTKNLNLSGYDHKDSDFQIVPKKNFQTAFPKMIRSKSLNLVDYGKIYKGKQKLAINK